MEELWSNVTQITGAVNDLLEKILTLAERISHLDALSDASTSNNADIIHIELVQTPATIEYIREIRRLPDLVNKLQVCDGYPVHYVSWVHSVEGILADFSVVKGKPLYNVIYNSENLPADSYTIFVCHWLNIKECLSLHNNIEEFLSLNCH